MKKTIALLLLIPFCLCLFSCGGNDAISYEDAVTVSDDTGIKDAFSVVEKKKTYKGKDIEILYVKNNTENEYFITVSGSFLDSAGEKAADGIKRTKTLFESSEVCFIFQPGTTFDRFDYEISSEKKDSLSDGKFSFSSFVTAELGPNPVDVNEERENVRATMTYMFTVRSDFSGRKWLAGYLVVFDNTGEIAAIHEYNKASPPGMDIKVIGFDLEGVFWEDGMKSPENLEGQLEVAFDYEYSDSEE